MVTRGVRGSAFGAGGFAAVSSGEGANVVWSISLQPASAMPASRTHPALMPTTVLQQAGRRARWPPAPAGTPRHVRSDQPAYRRQAAVGQPDGDGGDRRHAEGRGAAADADGGGTARPRP